MMQLLQHLLQDVFLVVPEKHVMRSNVWLDWNVADQVFSSISGSYIVGVLLPLEL